MDSPASDAARQQLNLTITPELYARIRRLWIQHSIAEDKRDIAGLLETLTPNCVYEVVPTGQRWEGHVGATEFYTTFLTAFPDVKFQLRDIVIGPQGVIEVADMTGTHLGEWAGQPPTGTRVKLVIIINFPWVSDAQKFAGEKVYFDQAALFPSSEPHTK
jgi:predicted ester cyclase